MPFTAEEKVRIRHHLGYLNVTNAATFSLGIPQAVETQFMVENAFNLVLPEAEGEVRRHVRILDALEEQMVCDHELLAVTKIGDVDVRGDEQDQLERRYLRWRQGLANAMGIVPNPFDKRYSAFGGAGGGLNVSVVH
jgi:hypothetical protein